MATGVNVLLGMLGLSTQQQLKAAVARKQRWHALVTDVFARYYIKFRESSLDYLPELPRRYTPGWETHMRQELDQFVQLDLESVSDMLQVCGFGTEKWERLTATGFPAFRRLVDQYLEDEGNGDAARSGGGNGHVSSLEIDAAVDEDIQRLFASQPEIFEDFLQRFDPDTGMFIPTEEELKSSLAYRRLAEKLEAAQLELKKFRKGGSKALDRMQRLEKKIRMLEHALAQRPSETRREASVETPADYGTDGGAAVDDLTEGLFDNDDSGNGHPAVEATTAVEDAGSAADVGDLFAGAATPLEDSGAPADAGDLFGGEMAVEGPGPTPGAGDLVAGPEDETPSLSRAELERASTEAAELAEEVEALKRELAARDHSIEGLERTMAELQEQADHAESSASELREVRRHAEAAEEELQQQIDQLGKDVRTREHTIDGLKEDQEVLEAKLEAAIKAQAQSSGEEAAAEAAERFRENQELRQDLRAREHTIEGLQRQLEQFEEDLGRSREQLLTEVQKLKELTSGDVEIRPSEELERMDSNQLLHYARDVAEDLDVRRQTLDEGLQGIDTIKDSFEENKKVHEEQQQHMAEEMQSLQGEMEKLEKEREALKAAASKPDASSQDVRDVISQQRQQLELLSTRIRQLGATKAELEAANKKTYADLEASVRRLIPLRKQLEELASLRDALSQYIREKYDRTFTVSKLEGGGK